MLFVLADWQRGTVGVDFELVRAVHNQALMISAGMPEVTGSADLDSVHHQLTLIRTAMGDVRRASTEPDALPKAELTELELALWALGLARHLTQRRVL